MTKTQKIYLQTFMLLILAINLAVLLLLITTFNAVISLTEVETLYHTQEIVPLAEVTMPNINIPEVPEIIPKDKPPSDRELIDIYVDDICNAYDVNPELVKSIIQQESEYIPSAKNGTCLGLMQISTKWHTDRAEKLGVTDFYDPYSNIWLGVDYLSELFKKYKDPKLVLMLYNMKHDVAFKMYSKGKTSNYAKSILARAEVYKKGE